MTALNLNRIQTFVAIVDNGSLTGGARAIGLTKAMVSMSLKQLEGELGCTLINRSTRRLDLTDIGRRFYEDCQRIIADANAAVGRTRQSHTGLTGELRITSTIEFGLEFVVAALSAFRREHPALRVEFSASGGLSDLVLERFDVAIRLGGLRDSTYKAALLRRFRLVAVVSLSHLERHLPVPCTPTDLHKLDWMSLTGSDRRFMLSDAQNEKHSVRISPMLQSNSAQALRRFALLGEGATVLPDWMVESDLESGRLLQLLPDFRLPELSIHAVFLNSAHVPAKVREFVDFVLRHSENYDWSDGGFTR